jgi:hypothetical protein
VCFVLYDRKASPESSHSSRLSTDTSSMSFRNPSSGGVEGGFDLRVSGSAVSGGIGSAVSALTSGSAASIVTATTPTSVRLDKSSAGDPFRNATKLEDMNAVWDFQKIERRGGSGTIEDRSWCCGWCGMVLKGWNATKAMNHVSKATGNNDVKACTGNIPKETLSAFRHVGYARSHWAAVRQRETGVL